ncbi:MAG: polymer-forming cytoskeletal protein [Rhodanobacteraceae bacterium]
MMFGNDKRTGKPLAAITTLIAEGTVIRGDVQFSGGLHLDGMVEGSITADGADAVLTLSEKGRVNGEIRTSNAVINGEVSGDVVATERLELAPKARVEGNIYYAVLEMAAGAQINGKIMHQSDAPRQLSRPELVVAKA